MFDGNLGSYITHGFIMINSDLVLANTLVQNSQLESTVIGFFSMLSQSTLTLRDHTVIRDISARTSLLVSKNNCNLTIANGTQVIDTLFY